METFSDESIHAFQKKIPLKSIGTPFANIEVQTLQLCNFNMVERKKCKLLNLF